MSLLTDFPQTTIIDTAFKNQAQRMGGSMKMGGGSFVSTLSFIGLRIPGVRYR